jgi:hypothetical protein
MQGHFLSEAEAAPVIRVTAVSVMRMYFIWGLLLSVCAASCETVA